MELLENITTISKGEGVGWGGLRGGRVGGESGQIRKREDGEREKRKRMVDFRDGEKGLKTLIGTRNG